MSLAFNPPRMIMCPMQHALHTISALKYIHVRVKGTYNNSLIIGMHAGQYNIYYNRHCNCKCNRWKI